MAILYLLIPLGLLFLGLFVWIFIWSVKDGQFDDLEGPAFRILMDDDDPKIPGNEKSKLEEERQE
ncbi:MAG: cbb3-type cytochrome oxidase assembly protein CcoS [Gammaproteobacteria bacterium]|nr:cbb3-type cytochrome oxidase assembly protein CcoS [Gammaproteobacteria bacterium]